MHLTPWLQLTRISTLPTLVSNVLTAFWLGGVALGSPPSFGLLGWIVAVSGLFYLGGMVLNDFYDTELDAVERPERPIPSGKISKRAAEIVGCYLLCGGIFVLILGKSHFAGASNSTSILIIGLSLFYCIFLYNFKLKQSSILGPVTMGLCRLLNILLVLTAVGVNPAVVEWTTPKIYALSVYAYIICVTYLSRYEATSPLARRLVGLGLAMLIPIDAVWCLFGVGVVPALTVLALYPLAMLLRRIVPMT